MNISFETFLDHVYKKGLEFFGVYYGLVRCRVVDNKDPDQLGYIRVGTLYFGGDSDEAPIGNWIPPVFPFYGWFSPPEIGEYVWVQFDCGSPRHPVRYLGTAHPIKTKQPSEFAYKGGRPTVRGFISRLGHRFLWSDEPGNEFVRIIKYHPNETDTALLDNSSDYADRTTGKSAMLEFNSKGDINLINESGAMIFMNAQQNQITISVKQGTGAGAKANIIAMTKDGITVMDGSGKNFITLDKGNIRLACENEVSISAKTLNVKVGGYYLGEGYTSSVVKGEELLAWLSKHVHPTGFGPSLPPTEPPVSKVILSSNGKVK